MIASGGLHRLAIRPARVRCHHDTQSRRVLPLPNPTKLLDEAPPPLQAALRDGGSPSELAQSAEKQEHSSQNNNNNKNQTHLNNHTNNNFLTTIRIHKKTTASASTTGRPSPHDRTVITFIPSLQSVITTQVYEAVSASSHGSPDRITLSSSNVKDSRYSDTGSLRTRVE